jgi:hypothetical protein
MAKKADRNQLRTKNRGKDNFADSLEQYRQEFAADTGLDPQKIRKPIAQTETNIKPPNIKPPK